MRKYKILILLLIIAVEITAVNPVAEALKVKGDVILLRNDVDYEVIQGENFFNGDQVETKMEAFAAVRFSGEKTLIKLFPSTILKINTEKQDNSLIKRNILEIGELWAKVESGSGDFKVETPTTIASVKGTNFLIRRNEAGLTQLFTFEGSVEMTNKTDGNSVMVDAGKMCETIGSGVLSISDIDYDLIDNAVSDFIDEKVTIPKPDKKQKSRPDSGGSSGAQSMPDAEEIEFEEESKSSSGGGPFNLGGGVGSVLIGDNTYTSIRLLPEATFGKIGIGLDVELLIDENGKIRKKDWDEWQDYVNKVYYIRYGKRGDKFFGKIGGFKNYTLAHGLLMKDYSNMLLYPDVKQLGLQLGGRLPYMGMQIEGFTSNINENQILAARAAIQPLTNLSLPIIKNISVGATFVTDRDQYGGLTDEVIDSIPIDTDGDGIYDEFDVDPDGDGLMSIENLEGLNPDQIDALEAAGLIDNYEDLEPLTLDQDPVSGISIDYNLPLVQTKLFALGHYSELAHIIDHKAGLIFPGFYSKFLIFNANLEYRFFQEDFTPGYFGNLYDQQRAVVNGNEIVLKEDLLSQRQKSRGWFGSITANLFNVLFLTSAYEDMYPSDDDRIKSIWASARLDKRIIPRLNRAEIKYSQTDFDDFTKFKTPNALISGEIAYALGGNTQLVARYQQRYIDYNGDGNISGKSETITTMNMGVEFRF